MSDSGTGPSELQTGGPARRATLEVLRGHNVGARFVLGPITAIGRSPENAIFLDDVSVSRSHARITEAGPARFVVSDLDSLNGTYLAGERVDDAILANGDVLQIGMYKLVFVDTEDLTANFGTARRGDVG